VPAPQKRQSIPRPEAEPQAERRKLVTATRVFGLVVIVLLVFGYKFPTNRYLSPHTGAGYALGIIGGSLMLALLLYPARKRWRWLNFMGTTKRWFQVHMIFGIVGPLLILFHSNFSFGATNSNVALFCMLVVSGSGLFGRYFYTHIHHGLYGSKATLTELRSHAERLRTSSATTVALLPELAERLEAEEKRLMQRGMRAFVLLRPFVAGFGTLLARLRLYVYVKGAIRTEAAKSPTLQQHASRLYKRATIYVDARLNATRRVIEFDAYERLFSLWHLLHLPLFFMLLIAGIVHVVAVHVY
jgi:hypothetical protein